MCGRHSPRAYRFDLVTRPQPTAGRALRLLPLQAASKGVVITDLRLLAKSGGKSGDWEAGGGGA